MSKKERIYNEFNEAVWQERIPGQRYVWSGGALVPVTEEYFREHQRWINAIHTEAWRAKECVQPDYTKCQGDCEHCRWWKPKNEALPDPNPESGEAWAPAAENAIEGTIGEDEVNQANEMSVEEVILRLAVCRIVEQLRETEPNNAQICELVKAGKTTREAAEILGWKEATFRLRRDTLFKRLRQRKEVRELR